MVCGQDCLNRLLPVVLMNAAGLRFGCATRPIPNLPEARASRMCSSPETGLSLETAAKLSEVMPGAGGRSCLERYEYAKHGGLLWF
ncbi:ribonuclease I [Escherichia coli]|uniref:Ribonuclease I n=1 Tax=Escherichia coli TaxID=562 RepID=A0A376TKA5_ECOLX|nr:ribonuclease I [Escherichia coli]